LLEVEENMSGGLPLYTCTDLDVHPNNVIKYNVTGTYSNILLLI